MALNEMVVLLVLLPLLGAVSVGLSVRRISDGHAQFLTCAPMVLSFILSLFVFAVSV